MTIQKQIVHVKSVVLTCLVFFYCGHSFLLLTVSISSFRLCTQRTKTGSFVHTHTHTHTHTLHHRLLEEVQ